MWTLKELLQSCNEVHVEIDGQWVPSRPINWLHRSFREKVREAWMVYKGEADCFIWPGKQ